MSVDTYLLAAWAGALVAASLLPAHRSFRLWRRKRAFRRLVEQLRRCAELHPIPTARTGQISGE